MASKKTRLQRGAPQISSDGSPMGVERVCVVMTEYAPLPLNAGDSRILGPNGSAALETRATIDSTMRALSDKLLSELPIFDSIMH